MYLRAPYSISSISEHYNQRMDEAFQGITNIRKIVDVIVYDQDKQQHLDHVREILHQCEDKGISLNRDKFQLCQTEARFAGLQLTQKGYSVMKSLQLLPTSQPLPLARTSAHSVALSTSWRPAPTAFRVSWHHCVRYLAHETTFYGPQFTMQRSSKQNKP